MQLQRLTLGPRARRLLRVPNSSLLSRPTRLTWALGLLIAAPAMARPRQATPQATPQEVPAHVELPEGPNARALAGVGAQTVALDLQRELLDERAWLRDQGAATWTGWGAAVKCAAREPEGASAAHAALVLCAARQGRHQDAWGHLERLGGFPEWSAAMLPMLLPGVPLDSASGVGGLPGALPDGVLLTPAVPPHSGAQRPGRIEQRTATLHGLRIGEAILDFKITIDSSGIEVDLLHTGGGPATVRVLLPEPEGLEIRVEYIDWMRQDELRVPLTVELLPGEEEHNLFGRFRPRRSPLPSFSGELMPRALQFGGLWLAWSGDEALEPELRTAAEVMATTLGVPGGLIEQENSGSGSPWSATILHVPRERDAARRFLSQIASRLEAWMLRER